MLRENNCAAGTTSTGTGTLTLAAPPAVLGAVGPYIAFTGLGLGVTQPTVMPYTIIEYSDATFVTPVQLERGLGYLTVTASISTMTLARTAVIQTQVVATPTNTRGTILNPTSPISIGVAANTVVFIGPGIDDMVPALPGYNSSIGSDTAGYSLAATQTAVMTTPATGIAYYGLVRIEIADFVKTISFKNTTNMTTPTTQSFLSALYTLNPTTFLPDRKLIDFGSSATALSTAGLFSLTATTGRYVMPGYYAIAYLAQWTGGSGIFLPQGAQTPHPSPWGSGNGSSVKNINVAHTTLDDQPGSSYSTTTAFGVIPQMMLRNT